MARTKRPPVTAQDDQHDVLLRLLPPDPPLQPTLRLQSPPCRQPAQIQPAQPTTLDLDNQDDAREFPLTDSEKAKILNRPNVKRGLSILDNCTMPTVPSYESIRKEIDGMPKYPVEYVNKGDFKVEESYVRDDGTLPLYSLDDILARPPSPLPETSVSETSVPETSVPDTSVSETSPETSPETSVPETSVPETSVSETPVRETPVRETSVPDTSVPEGPAPTDNVPEVKSRDKGDPLKAVQSRYNADGFLRDINFNEYMKQLEKDLDETFEPKYGKTPFVMHDLSPVAKATLMAEFDIETEEILEAMFATVDPISFLISRLSKDEMDNLISKYDIGSEEELERFVFVTKYMRPQLNIVEWANEYEKDGILANYAQPSALGPEKPREPPTLARGPTAVEEREWASNYKEVQDAMNKNDDAANMDAMRAALAKPYGVVPVELPMPPKRGKAPKSQASGRRSHGNGRANEQPSGRGEKAPIASAGAPSQITPAPQIPVVNSQLAASSGIKLPVNNNSTAVQEHPISLTAPKRKRETMEIPDSEEDVNHLEPMELPKERELKSIARGLKRRKVHEAILTSAEEQLESRLPSPRFSPSIVEAIVEADLQEATLRESLIVEEAPKEKSHDGHSMRTQSLVMDAAHEGGIHEEPPKRTSGSKRAKTKTSRASQEAVFVSPGDLVPKPPLLPLKKRKLVGKLASGSPISLRLITSRPIARQPSINPRPPKRPREQENVDEEELMAHSARSKRAKIQTGHQTIPSTTSSVPMLLPKSAPPEKIVHDSKGEGDIGAGKQKILSPPAIAVSHSEGARVYDDNQAILPIVTPLPVSNQPRGSKRGNTGLNGGFWTAPISKKRRRGNEIPDSGDEENEAPEQKVVKKQKKTTVSSQKSPTAPKKPRRKASKKGPKPKETETPPAQPQVAVASQPQVVDPEDSSDPGDAWD